MSTPLALLTALRHCLVTATVVLLDLGRLLAIAVRSRRALAAENLFLQKQLAVFQERKVKPRRANDSTRWMMATLSRMFQSRDVLLNVKPDTLISWHRKGFRLFLALEIQANGKTAFAQRPAAIDPTDGRRQYDTGRGTYCKRAQAETRD